MTEKVLKVAVPAPLRTVFDYLPPRTGPIPQPGTRVKVSFGRGQKIGVVWGQDYPESPPGKIKAISELIDANPILPKLDREFLQWAATYYQHPLGEVVAAALPLILRRGAESAPETAPVGWRLTDEAHKDNLTLGARQRVVMERLREMGGESSMELLLAACESADPTADFRGALRRLRNKGLVEPKPLEIPPGVMPGAASAGPQLSEEQGAAVDAVATSMDGFGVYLLDGVTGSGKTEVYIELARRAVESGRQVLILVPEISLTPQLERRLLRRLEARFAVLHSGRNDGDRSRAWLATAKGDADILVGTRSAIFTPMPKLGLIVVDEEHDPSFKQQEGFRYSARDLAAVKGRMADCPVVFGSATPSLESLANVERGRYRSLHLTRRVAGASLPPLVTVDIRAQRLESGLAPDLIRAMRAELEAGNQALLFLNRRGYAPVLTCHACGWLAQCPHCDARLTYHASGKLWCHHCGYQLRSPESCPDCAAEDLRVLGQGTERLEENLERLFPDAGVLRIDRDATRRKGSLDKALAMARSGEASLLLGTQMLAKGHHFPGVTLVGIVDADAGLFSADFRAPERTAQLLYQVAGRAGRAAKPGRVLVQTRHPEHPVFSQLSDEGYGAFVRQALAERREAKLPPYSFQALVRASATKKETPQAFLAVLSQHVRSFETQVDPWGPVPAPMERKGGRYRSHLLLQAPKRMELQRVLDWLVALIPDLAETKGVRWSLDVDPVDLS